MRGSCFSLIYDNIHVFGDNQMICMLPHETKMETPFFHGENKKK